MLYGVKMLLLSGPTPFFFFKQKLMWTPFHTIFYVNAFVSTKTKKPRCVRVRRFYSTSTTHRFSLSHASPSQLSSPTQKNNIIKSPLQVHLLFLHAVTKKSSSSRVSGPVLLEFLRRHWQLKIASESHSSSGRFIPLPPFVPCFIHCHCSLSPLFPNLDFCSIYQISSSHSHITVLLCFFVCP